MPTDSVTKNFKCFLEISNVLISILFQLAELECRVLLNILKQKDLNYSNLDIVTACRAGMSGGRRRVESRVCRASGEEELFSK